MTLGTFPDALAVHGSAFHGWRLCRELARVAGAFHSHHQLFILLGACSAKEGCTWFPVW